MEEKIQIDELIHLTEHVRIRASNLPGNGNSL